MREQRPILILLPGMDGTGELFHEMRHYFDSDIETIVIDYPRNQKLSYLQLENLVRAQLPEQRRFMLLGESFSGPIAISLASQNVAHLCGLIICASFCRNPQPLLRPFYSCIDYISPRLIPRLVLERVMFGNRGSQQQRENFFKSLYSVNPAVIQYRCKQVLKLNYVDKLKSIAVPALYLQGEHDHLVAARHAKEIAHTIQNLKIHTFPTAHMLLQTEPESTAKVISQFVREC